MLKTPNKGLTKLLVTSFGRHLLGFNTSLVLRVEEKGDESGAIKNMPPESCLKLEEILSISIADQKDNFSSRYLLLAGHDNDYYLEVFGKIDLHTVSSQEIMPLPQLIEMVCPKDLFSAVVLFDNNFVFIVDNEKLTKVLKNG